MAFWNKKKPLPVIEEKFDLSGFEPGETDSKFNQKILKNLNNTFRTDINAYKITEQVLDKNGNMFAQDASQLQRQKVLSGVANLGSYGAGISPIQLNFFAQQGFIGNQTNALLAQNWLINKACTVPARDAVRNGYKITANEGVEIDPKKLSALREMDKRFKINDQLIEYIRMANVFGIRIAMFNIEGIDYEKPFNLDGVKKNSYKSISQIDPYWITPELDFGSASNPADPNFYEPTWWRVNDRRIHKSHLMILIPNPVADILKPTYVFGGMSRPQLIVNRVYAAEKCANESPLLLLTKRLFILKCDMAAAISNQEQFEERLAFGSQFMDNYGTRAINDQEEIDKLETSLADLDETIMTQYQLVASASNMPATKLIETTPKGFSSTGEYEEASYHEYLESIQANDLTPFLNRHHDLCIRSEVSPGAPFQAVIEWEPLDAMTAIEKAKLRKFTADADKILVEAKAFSSQELREKEIADPASGWNGIQDETEDDENIEDIGNANNALGGGEGDKTVQQVSMNGAQVLALVQILTDVSSGQMPADTAKVAIAAAYNSLDPDEIDDMVDPMAQKAKTNPNPVQNANSQAPDTGETI